MELLLTKKHLEQIILAIDLAENTLEELTEADIARLDLGIDRKVLFGIADYLQTELESQKKVGA
jgi:hypothetical protein